MGFRVFLGLLASALAFPTASLAANIVSLSPLNFDPAVATGIGDRPAAQLAISFTDDTLGGGVTIGFDPAVVRLAAILFDPGFMADDIDLRCPNDPSASNPVSCGGNPHLISFGNPGAIPAGVYDIAEVVFEAVGAGNSALDLTVVQPFAGTSGALTVSTTGTSLLVPEPATACMLGAALALLAGRRRRRARG